MKKPRQALTLLHTSDWHLGRALYGRRRYAEFAAFLDWLLEAIRAEGVEVLLVAGDIFDTGTPSSRAQELYYRFLRRVGETRCANVVIIGGNHDSPSFLNAPRDVLRALNVYVLGAAGDDPADEVLTLYNAQGEPALVVAAVPYLRERDIRLVEDGESLDDKGRKSGEGIRRHYAQVCALALKRQAELGGAVPLVGMGHLFTAGGKTVDGDGVRELSVGSLTHVPGDIFPEYLEYVALGHLHVPQVVGGREHVRYSGSPLPMGFGEANDEKSVCLARLVEGAARVRLLPVPRFQLLERVRGDLDSIVARLESLKAGQSTAWLEVLYEGDALAGDLRETLEECLEHSDLELLRIGNSRLTERILAGARAGESLADLSLMEVFERCLSANDIPEDQGAALRRVFAEVVTELHEGDKAM